MVKRKKNRREPPRLRFANPPLLGKEGSFCLVPTGLGNKSGRKRPGPDRKFIGLQILFCLDLLKTLLKEVRHLDKERAPVAVQALFE